MGGTGRALLGVLAGGYSFSTAHGRLDFCCWWGHGETKARSSFCPQTQFQPPLAQNARGASQHTGITLLVGGGSGWSPVPRRPLWLLGTADGGRGQLSCPVPPGARPRTLPCERPSGALAPAPCSTAMRCHSLLLALCTLAGKGCAPRGGGLGGHPVTPHLCLWGFVAHGCTAPCTIPRGVPMLQPAVPVSCPADVPGVTGVGDGGGGDAHPPHLHAGTLIHTVRHHSRVCTPTGTHAWISPPHAHTPPSPAGPRGFGGPAVPTPECPHGMCLPQVWAAGTRRRSCSRTS